MPPGEIIRGDWPSERKRPSVSATVQAHLNIIHGLDRCSLTLAGVLVKVPSLVSMADSRSRHASQYMLTYRDYASMNPMSLTKLSWPKWGALLLASGLTACAVSPEDSDRWRTSQAEVLKERVEARWKHVVNGDIDKAYEFLTPEYRAVVPLQQYRGKYGRALEWRVARVAHVGYDSPTVASVSVEVTYRADLPGVRSGSIETVKTLTEKWLYMDGGWWYTAK